MHKCYYCGHESVIWGTDFTFEDFGYETEGVVQEYHCMNCGANITYSIPLDEDNLAQK